MLNLEDFGASGVGEDGRRDLRIAGLGDPGGDIARICLGAGAVVRIVGAASCLMEERMERPPLLVARFPRAFWKLLADASESLSYAGTGFAAAAGMLSGLALAACTFAGMCLFCRAPRGGFCSAGGMLCRDAASPALLATGLAGRMLLRICG